MLKNLHLAAFYVVIAFIFFIMLGIKIDDVRRITQKQREYNLWIDQAVDDAVDSLVERVNGQEIYANRNYCVDNFFHSLYANFGVLGSKEAQEKLKLYIPVMLITDLDGFYLYRTDWVKDGNGRAFEVSGWSEKKPYTFSDNNFVYNFTLNDYLKIFDKNMDTILEGKYYEIARFYPSNAILNDADLYDRVRRKCIIDGIVDEMELAVNQHNRAAMNYGITYHFALPLIAEDVWYQTIDDISFMAVFQGYPYGGFLGFYNRYAIGGAKVIKRDRYYIAIERGIFYYHKSNCSLVTDRSRPFDSRKECAMTGAFPCDECRP